MKKTSHILWGFMFIVIVWLLGHYLVDSRFIPNPVMIIAHTVTLLGSSEFWLHIIVSGLRLFTSIGLSLVLGSISGVLIAKHRSLDLIFSPVLYILFPVPKAAFLPIIFVFFGLSDVSKVILIFLILYFQIAMSAYDAVKSIDESLFLAARSLRLKGWHLYRHLIIPAILPNLFTALRISIGIGVAVLFFVETYATRYGLGYYIMNHWSLLDYKNMYSGILTLSIMGYATFRMIDKIEKRLIKYR